MQQDHDWLHGEESIITLFGACVLVGWPRQISPILPWIIMDFRYISIPNLGLRYTTIPAQYSMLVLQRSRNKSQPHRSDTYPGRTILTPRPQRKYAPIATDWPLRHVWLLRRCINVLHSNLWLPARAGERPWRSETIGVAAKKRMNNFVPDGILMLGSWCFLYSLQMFCFWFVKLHRAPRGLFVIHKLVRKNDYFW